LIILDFKKNSTFIDFGATGNDFNFLISCIGCKIEENHSNKQIKIFDKYTGLTKDSLFKINNPAKIILRICELLNPRHQVHKIRNPPLQSEF
jgi:hypothetical protein